MKFVQFNRKKFVLAILMAGMFSLILLGIFLVGISLTSPVNLLEFIAVILGTGFLLPVSFLISCQSGTWFDDETKEGKGTRILIIGFDPDGLGMKNAQRGKKLLMIIWILITGGFAFLSGLAVGEVGEARLQYPLIFLLALLYQGLGFVTEHLGRDPDEEPTKAGTIVFTLLVVVLLLGDMVGFLLPLGIFLFKQGTPGATLTLWNPFMIGFWLALSWPISRYATWAYYNLSLTQSLEIKN